MVVDDAELDAVVEQSDRVRVMFGQMISDACQKLAEKLNDDPSISVPAFAIGVEMGAMAFAACAARINRETEESFLHLARCMLQEKEPPEMYDVARFKKPRSH